ncbi:hypothetical protein J6O86_09680 [bacterium]|nr:hypothetical protein [bacterium]
MASNQADTPRPELRKGRYSSARRSFSRAKRFLPIGKNTYYCVSSLMPPSGGIVISEFFFFGSFFLFASRQKEKMNIIRIS